MKTPPRPSARQGYSIIECLVYGFVLLVLLGVAYGAFYQCVDNSYAARRNADDLTSALRAGERWRADVRAAGGSIKAEQTSEGDLLRLVGERGQVDYQVSSNAILRRVNSGPWQRLLENVKASEMLADSHPGVTAWRWELELKPRTKKPVRLAPLFTFTAVPERSATR